MSDRRILVIVAALAFGAHVVKRLGVHIKYRIVTVHLADRSILKSALRKHGKIVKVSSGLKAGSLQRIVEHIADIDDLACRANDQAIERSCASIVLVRHTHLSANDRRGHGHRCQATEIRINIIERCGTVVIFGQHFVYSLRKLLVIELLLRKVGNEHVQLIEIDRRVGILKAGRADRIHRQHC